MLTKEQFVTKYSEIYGATKKEAKKNLEEVLYVMQRAIIEDGGFNFVGVMKAEKIYKEARESRNPQTGEQVMVPAKYKVKAKFSEKFVAMMNKQ